MAIEKSAAPPHPFASVACTVNVYNPASDGVPPIAPPLASARPDGRVPVAPNTIRRGCLRSPSRRRRTATPNVPPVNGPDTAIAGHTEVPARSTPAEPPLLLSIISLAVFAPGVVGVNTTSTGVADPPGSEDVPGAPAENCAASAPVMVNGAVSVTSAVLWFVIVIVALAADPSATDPKF